MRKFVIVCVVAILILLPAALAVACQQQPRQVPPTGSATGQVQGRVIDEDSGQPLEGVLVVLCEIVGGLKCQLRAQLQIVTDETGSFIISGVPEGSYTAAFASSDMVPKVHFEDGQLVDYE